MCTVFILGAEERYTNYRRAIEAAGGRVCFSASPDRAYSCDALLLPGGGDLEPWRYGQSNTHSRGLEPGRDAAEFMLLEHFSVVKKPVLGICRGLQTINVYFGGTLRQDIPGHSAEGGTDRVHGVRTAPSFLSGVCGKLVNSAHHQAAERLGCGLLAVQWAPDGVVEAVCHRGLPVWGVQWHPERLAPEIPGAGLFRAFLSLCG